jgi:hypothetical protein
MIIANILDMYLRASHLWDKQERECGGGGGDVWRCARDLKEVDNRLSLMVQASKAYLPEDPKTMCNANEQWIMNNEP